MKKNKAKLLSSDSISNRDISITGFRRARDFAPKIKNALKITQKEDTMLLLCFCGHMDNYYFKEVEFKKGVYFVDLVKGTPHIAFNEQIRNMSGSEIRAPASIQNILFKNTLARKADGRSRLEDLLFKELKFKVIDFSDTVNIKLEPISENEFWKHEFWLRPSSKLSNDEIQNLVTDDLFRTDLPMLMLYLDVHKPNAASFQNYLQQDGTLNETGKQIIRRYEID